MSFQYFPTQQNYPQNSARNEFDQGRSSSSASQSHSQAFDDSGFQLQDGSSGYPIQYDYPQSNEWPESTIGYSNLSHTNASNFDPTDLNGYTRPENEASWDPLTKSYGRGLSNNLQLFPPPPALIGPKAQTVAGEAYSSQVFKRPLPRPRQSFASVTDSGYGSQPTNIDNITSAKHEDVRPLDFYAVGPQLSFPEAPAPPSSVKTDPHPAGYNKSIKRRRSKTQVSGCQFCAKELKNKSEAEKHRLQHEKPYRCDLCRRKDGFATLNDLERHRKSVHRVCPKVGKKSIYFCKACRPSPGSKHKQWPRLDNFKAHIKRKHPTHNLDQLIKESELERPDYVESQYGHSQHSTSIPPDEMTYQQDLSSSMGNPMSRNTSQQHGDFNTLFNHDSNQLAHVGGVVDYQINQVRDVQFHHPQYPTDNGVLMLHSAAQHLTSPTDSMDISPRTARYSVPTIALNDQAFSQYGDDDVEGPSPKRHRTQSMPSPSTSHATISSCGSSGQTEGEHRCQVCKKVKKRECDLRKHMKRHTRPYGCTFAKCNKRFGSRNDWKRHENSQHFLSEMWRCDLDRAMGGKCGHLSHDRDMFAKHLEVSHNIKEVEENRTLCRRMHLGREGHHHFWCGFCNKLIEQAGGIQPGAWDVRFKHIGDHFDKEALKIDDWVDIEKNKKKKVIEDEEKHEKAVKLKLDDDSDLPEDGIPPIYSFEVDAEGDTDDDFPS